MIELLVNESYQRSTISEVKRTGEGYEIKKDDGWSLWISDSKNKMNVSPRVGDTIIVYGDGIGHEILGIQINSALVWFEDRAEKNRQRNIWIEETKKKNEAEYKQLMEKIKEEEPFETVDISGMGSGYERACQHMLRAGMKFLKENEFHFDYYTIEGVYGLCLSDAPWSKDLNKALSESVGGNSTGAMHQCVIGHLGYIHEHGYEKWLSKFPEERRYTYPTELPPSSFGKEHKEEK